MVRMPPVAAAASAPRRYPTNAKREPADGLVPVRHGDRVGQEKGGSQKEGT